MNSPSPPDGTAPADAGLDQALSAALALPALPDDGFSAAVLRRVQALQGARWLGADEAQALVRARQRRSRVLAQSSRVGLGVGLGMALAWAGWTGGGVAAVDGPWSVAGLAVLGGAAVALALLHQATD